jgi:hypothetical protein
MGLLSPAALATPLLLVLPAGAVGAGLLAVAKIRTSGGALSGSGLARWGMALGLACAVATVVRGPVRDALLRRQMAAVASQWLNLLAQERIEDATHLMGGAALQALGPPESPPGAEPPSAAQSHQVALANLRNDKLTQRLIEFAVPLRVAAEPVPGEDPVFEGPRVLLVSHFTIRPAEGDQSLRAELRLARSEFYEADGRPWRVEFWRLLD